MKFYQLIEYNLRKNFCQKLYLKYGGEAISRSFVKKRKLSRSLNQYFKVLYILFLFFAKMRAIEID